MDPKEAELTLLSLQYERQISRAHTIFSSFWDIFFGVMVGFLGLVLSLKQIEFLEFNRLTFIIILIVLGCIVGLVGIVAFYFWYESKVEREILDIKIRALPTAHFSATLK